MADSVLIVDDHPLTREALGALLTQHGFSVVGQASDGEEAVGCARRLQPRLVLLDLSMPGLSGLEALPRLREAAPGCEVVVLTASGTEENLLSAIRGVSSTRCETGGGVRASRTRSRACSRRVRSRCCSSSTSTLAPTRSRAGSSSRSTPCGRT